MDKVYVVWGGEYDDPYLSRIFQSRDTAEEYARIINEKEGHSMGIGDLCAEGLFVEEWDVESNLESALGEYVYGIHITFDYKNGKILKKSTSGSIACGQNDMDVTSEIERNGVFLITIARSYREELRDPITDDRLLKIAQDRWAQFKARMEGIR